MTSILVKEMMVPLEEYATVSEEADLYEAVRALEEAREKYSRHAYRHRAVLVYDAQRRIVGKLSQLDVIRSLEPKYKGIGELKDLTRFGLSDDYLRKMIRDYGLWKSPLDDICKTAANYKVKDIMYTPTEKECIAEEASLQEAIHQLIMGNHQSLLVCRRSDIVGILRLTDVFSKVCGMITACRI
ncbi:MAG: CBS domain-containing protein [Desulfobacterales bacterium]|nr:CBS domain-containing protein [Desulfobacterales bacterium]